MTPTPETFAPIALDQQPGPTGASVRLAVVALLLVMLLSALDQTIMSAALPTIVSDLGGLDTLSWVVTAYLLSSTVVLPLYGKLGDLYGRRIVLQAAIALFLAGSALCGLAQDMTQLIALRALQGLGGGGLVVIPMAAFSDLLSRESRNRYQSMISGLYGLATVVGLPLGGFLVQHLSWRWIFYINLPPGALALVAIGAAFRPHTAHVRHRIDYMGAAFLAVALTCVILFTSQADAILRWSPPQILMTLAPGLVAVGAFVYVERLAAEPVIPLALFRHRTFVMCSLISFIVGSVLFFSVTFIPLYLQVVKGSTPFESGMQQLPMIGGIIVASIASGHFVTKPGKYRRSLIVGTLLCAVAMVLLSTLTFDMPLCTTYLYLALLGLGIGRVLPVLELSMQNTVEFRYMGVATSCALLFRLCGGSLGVATFGALFSDGLHARLSATLPRLLGPDGMRYLSNAHRTHYLDAFAGSLHTVYLCTAAVTGIAFVLAWLIEEVPFRKND